MDEKLASLFQPDCLLAAQYFETCRSKNHLEPEKKLMLAVLEDAITCFRKYSFTRNGKGRGLFREAERWICDENDDSPFSFEMICDVLGLSPSYVRRGLMEWKEKRMADRKKVKVYRLTERRGKNRPMILADRSGL
ncbi:MAG: hypothetical protein ONB06_07855 [candidate division KSB1 bacterium]|nr:hypothetical protein [candidate division KSB1 bacterium]